MSDCLKPPEIHRVERQEGRILVEASDNILVAKVVVTIFDEQNRVLEIGDAIRQEGDLWEFVTKVQGRKIRAQAWDLADNHTKMIV